MSVSGLAGAVVALVLILPRNEAASQTPMASPGSSAAPQSVPPRVLKQFVDECVAVAPGTGTFPAEFQYGPVHASEVTELKRSVHRMGAPFRICRYETTQELYEHVMGANPSRWKGPRNSVEYVSYEDAVQFCARLTVLLQRAGLIADKERVRLPTEPEWEYCCRAGTTSLFSFSTESDNPDQPHPEADRYAWHTGNAAGNDPPVGALRENPWGLHDMHGYLWEYTADDFSAPGQEKSSAAMKVIRGGSWRDATALLTSATRLGIPPHAVSDAIGFRCVID